MYLYTIGVLYSISIWAILFYFAPKVRKDMLISGLAWGHTGPILEYWHRQDYWQPEYFFPIRLANWTFGIEDYLFAFCYSGFAVGVFYLLLDSKLVLSRATLILKHVLLLQLTGAVFLAGFGLIIILFGINSVHALATLSIITSAALLAIYREWFFAMVVTSFIILAIVIGSYWGFYFRVFPDVLDRWWLLDNLSGYMFLGIPIEELIWAFGVTLIIGPVYRFTSEIIYRSTEN